MSPLCTNTVPWTTGDWHGGCLLGPAAGRMPHTPTSARYAGVPGHPGQPKPPAPTVAASPCLPGPHRTMRKQPNYRRPLRRPILTASHPGQHPSCLYADLVRLPLDRLAGNESDFARLPLEVPLAHSPIGLIRFGNRLHPNCFRWLLWCRQDRQNLCEPEHTASPAGAGSPIRTAVALPQKMQQRTAQTSGLFVRLQCTAALRRRKASGRLR